MEGQEKLLSTQEVIKRLKISRKTLYALMERGKIKPANDRPSYLSRHPKLEFRESDVERLLGDDPPDEYKVVA